MTIAAKYRFTDIDDMPVTIEMTATLDEWREVLKNIARDKGGADRALADCVYNIIKLIEEATGHSYSTRGYTYDCKKEANPTIADETMIPPADAKTGTGA